MTDVSPLFRPFTLRGVELKNRIVMAAMTKEPEQRYPSAAAFESALAAFARTFSEKWASEVEVALKAMAWPGLTIVRPSVIAGDRAESRPMERLAEHLLRGDITLVGPRPLPTHYWPRYRGDEYRRFEVKPGITGLAQVSGRNLVDWPERLALDVRYVEQRSLLGDARILVRTVPTVLSGSGVSNGQVVTMHALPADRPPVD